ncbi:MAG: hypothetical protein R3F29_10415 [Planctomycetota bacterium]
MLLALVTLLMMVCGALVRAPQTALEVADAVAIAHAAAATDASHPPQHGGVVAPVEHAAPGVEPEPDEKLARIVRIATPTRTALTDCGAAAAFAATTPARPRWSRQAARAPPQG